MQPTEGGWNGGESMRGWGGIWIEWTRVWDSCCCYDVPLESSWLVSLTEEVSASFIISWREKKTYSCKYIFHYCMINILNYTFFKCATLLFLTLLCTFICLGEKNYQIIDFTRTCFTNIQKVLQFEEMQNERSKISLLMPNAFK